MVKCRAVILLALTLTLLVTLRLPESHAVCNPVPCNTIVNPGFEDPTSTAWRSQDKTYGNGTVKIYDTSQKHTGSYSVMLNATKTKLVCPPYCSKDSVRASIEQYPSLSPSTPALDSLSTASDSFSAWWYVAGIAVSGMPSYSVHIGLVFADMSNNLYSIEYWYGTSDLSDQQYNLGAIPRTDGWFQMARNLTRDTQSLNIVNRAGTRIENIWFSAFGNSTNGEIAWVDDVSVQFVPHPVALFSASPVDGTSPLTVNFDGRGSGESSGASVQFGITSYRWDFGDGTSDVGVNSRVQHTFNVAGNYTVVLTVLDNNGMSSIASSRIRVAPGANSGGGWFGILVAAALGLALVFGVYFVRRRSRKSRKKKKNRTG